MLIFTFISITVLLVHISILHITKDFKYVPLATFHVIHVLGMATTNAIVVIKAIILLKTPIVTL